MHYAHIIAAAEASGATIVRTASTVVIVLAGSEPADGHVPLADAARIAGCSPRALRAAIRRGELPMFGRQRSRTVRRADLDAWIAGQRVTPRPAAPRDDVDADVERRMRRLGG
jgi:hypothetical protein